MEFWYNLKIKNIIVLYDEEYVLNIDVEYKDRHGTISNRNYNITKLALIKHMAIAGQKYAPNRHKILKTIGMLFQFSYYLQSSALRYNKFSLPPHSLYDPTEKGQFSNIVGKAIADFLAKRIDSARFTVNYEAAMKMRGMPIRGNRPDLLAFNNNETFAIEAKGYSGNSGNMTNHKLQSQTGGIAVNFTVASVSYKLYDRIKCKYHDPYNEEVLFDHELFNNLTKKYYTDFLDFLDYRYEEVKYQNEEFYEIDLFFPDLFEVYHYNNFLRDDLYDGMYFKKLKLILPINIRTYAKEGLYNTEPFLFQNNNDNIYIDNDRIGLRIE